MGKTALKTLSVYKTKPFARFASKADIADADLWKAAWQANQGIIDADLGGGVIKQLIARPGQGKSGGSRTIVLLKKDNRAVFVYGFEKKDKADIRPDELEAFRKSAQMYLGCTNAEFAQRAKDGALLKVEKPEREDNA